MAQVVTTELVDDLEGGPADETVRFGLDGHEYEIDLSGKRAKGLRKMAEGYAHCGRKRGPAHGAPRRPAAQRRRAATIREWAKEQGHMSGTRGRIPGWIEAEYGRVHGG